MKDVGICICEDMGEINWEMIKREAPNGVRLRAGYGGGVWDQKFREYAGICVKYEIPFSVYWESFARTEAEAWRETDAFLEVIDEFGKEREAYIGWSKSSLHYIESLGCTMTPERRHSLEQIFLQKSLRISNNRT